MNITYCPSCGTQIKKSSPPSFCTNCGTQINAKQPPIEYNHRDSSSNAITKSTMKTTWFIIPIMIIAAFVVGLFAPKLFADSGKEIAITLSKSTLTSFFSVVDKAEITETDLMFKGLKAKLVKKESEENPGAYEITGEFTHDRTTYMFTHEILFYDGIYFYYDMPDFEE